MRCRIRQQFLITTVSTADIYRHKKQKKCPKCGELGDALIKHSVFDVCLQKLYCNAYLISGCRSESRYPTFTAIGI
jgi:hypothetical protein